MFLYDGAHFERPTPITTLNHSDTKGSAPTSKRPETRVALERLLREGQAKNNRKVFRDKRRRPVLIQESVLDPEKLQKSGRVLAEVGRRIRHYDASTGKEIATYIAPVELTALSREEPETVAGVELPIGTVVSDHGLWLRHRPGIEEAGINDRGEVILREVKIPDPAAGAVRGAVNCEVAGTSSRLVLRLSRGEHEADIKEAEAWLRLFSVLEGRRTLHCQFMSAGIDFQHKGNVPHLQQTVPLNFFDLREIDMVRIASLLAFRFRKARRRVPSISVISVAGLPHDAAHWNALQKRMKSRGKGGGAGLPAKLQESRFYDPQAKGIVPASYVFFAPLQDLPNHITVLTVNTDCHGEIKSRGVFAPLTAALSQIDVISTHAGLAVLNTEGTATAFAGPDGASQGAACLFWAERSDRPRRRELRRRYESDIRRTPDAGRLGEPGIQKELDRILGGVGILCQQNWVTILKEGAAQWIFWPTERTFHAPTSGFPGLASVLQERHPLLENAAADFGASGDPENIGRVTHRCFSERLFYDPAWNHLLADRSSRRISAVVLLENDPALDFCARKLTAREAIDWLLRGRTLDGGFAPLHDACTDFCGMLIQLGVVGDRLLEAYEAAKKGQFEALGGGDAALGELIFGHLDVQVSLWLDLCREIPAYMVNGACGTDITHDINWVISEHPSTFGDWRHVTPDQFKAFMRERYGVAYGPRGEWSHTGPGESHA